MSEAGGDNAQATAAACPLEPPNRNRCAPACGPQRVQSGATPPQVRYVLNGHRQKTARNLRVTRRVERVCAYVRCYGQQYLGGDGDARQLDTLSMLELLFVRAIASEMDAASTQLMVVMVGTDAGCRCPKLFRYAHCGGHFGSCNHRPALERRVHAPATAGQQRVALATFVDTDIVALLRAAPRRCEPC